MGSFVLQMETLAIEILAEVVLIWASEEYEAPWVASAVNRHWRSSLLSCPRAWSKVYMRIAQPQRIPSRAGSMNILDDGEETSLDQSPPTELWLSRAKDADLDLSIEITGLMPNIFHIHERLKWLKPHMARVKTLQLDVMHVLVTDSLLDILWEHAPLLRYFLVKCSTSDDDLALHKLEDAVAKAPSMRSLHLSGCIVPLSIPPIPSNLPYHLLKSLSFESSQIRSARNLLICLEYCEALESFSLFRSVKKSSIYAGQTLFHSQSLSFDSDKSVPNPSEIITLLKLRSISIECASAKLLEGLFPRLDLPLLEDLSLIRMGNQGYKLGPILHQFVQNTPTIQRLSLEGAVVSDKSLLLTLKCLSNLTHLTLVSWPISKEGILGLSCRFTETPICPRLKTISLYSCDLIPPSPLLVCLQTRREKGHPIRTLVVLDCEQILPDHLDSIREVDPENLIVISSRIWF
ncbi:hypothetical protein BDQ12DRAFT_732752 [Crucibulum laeve]|uniref:F-box domain-containing protein n=1 Tax=Crucibulum laeve TaxID=68775 RepID=A0A5C3M9C0_9AGAR|nr:hypothetical protein BDQ12DRAFT_732752 [Crucibulum laeve]